MSLQVWMPLNGTLTNNGFHQASISQVGSTLGTRNGKVTSVAYNWTVDGQGISLNGFMNTFRTYTNYSISAWVYYSSPATNHSTSICSSGNWNTGAGQLCFGFYNHNGSGYTKLLVPNRSSWDWGIDLSSPLVANKWYHVTVTYGDGITRGYINGEYVGSLSAGGITDQSETSNLHIGKATYYDGFTIKGCINDFRIYDHCLSPKEVHEIAKGLVAHYQLKGMGATNYLKGAGKFLKNTPLVRNANDSSAMNDSYIYYDTSNMSVTLPSAGTYTFSVNSDGVGAAHPTSGTTASQRLFSLWLQNTSTSNHYHFAMSEGVDGRWYGTRTDLVAGTYKVRTNLYAADNVNYTVKFWNMKVSAGGYNPNDTWCPNSEDELYNNLNLGSMIGTDCSGYGKHASVVGSITANADTNRYGSSSCFNSGAYLSLPTMSFAEIANSYTFSYWAKIDDMSGKMVWGFMDGNRLNVYPSSHFNWNTGDGADNPFRNSSGTAISYSSYNGAWHHYAITGNGTTSTLYIDGNAVGTAKTYRSPTGSQIIISGWDTSGSYKWNGGSIVDYRIYATCLSSSEVAELYNTSASISKDGTLFAYDFHENKRNTIDKNGIVASSGFNTKVAPIADMKVKTLEDGSTWARIHYLDLTNDKTFFANASEVAKCTNKHNRYSRMGDVDKFKSTDGKYEFMLTYPTLSATGYNRWTQTSSPNATSVTGYIPISISWSAHSAGIRKHGSACLYNCDSGDTWYAPIGQYSIWEGGIPAANSTMQLQTELWVRTDKFADATQTKIYDGTIVASNFIEI